MGYQIQAVGARTMPRRLSTLSACGTQIPSAFGALSAHRPDLTDGVGASGGGCTRGRSDTARTPISLGPGETARFRPSANAQLAPGRRAARGFLTDRPTRPSHSARPMRPGPRGNRPEPDPPTSPIEAAAGTASGARTRRSTTARSTATVPADAARPAIRCPSQLRGVVGGAECVPAYQRPR